MRTVSYTYLMFILLSFLTACSSAVQEASKELVKPIKIGQVEAIGGLSVRTFNGITQSGSETKLSFRAGGLIARLNVTVGQRVQKGTLLAQLDQKDALLALDQAQLDVQNARVQMETASSNFERVKQLYESNNASLSDYDQAKSGFSNAQSAYEISLKRQDLQRSQVTYTSLYAPMAGIVSSVSIELNEVIRAGQTVMVMSREDASDLEAQAGLPEKYISQIKQGSGTQVRIPALDEVYEGVITEVGYTSTGGTYSVITSISKPGAAVRPGMPVEVTFTFGDENDVSQLVVPIKAVSEDESGQFVYLLQPLDEEVLEARKVNVEIGSLTAGGFIVRSGLQQDQLVAVAGLRSLYDGMKVKQLKP